ncbi:unnamed protein product [Spirodela intermedia]|uniref:Uncharacterized protein n=1 Tax=Spirodela intermedia TaxID=51605 RepID=A0ABN7EAV5_SPIIN|nr:unnamed protein product [Spirodela intermedia]
MSRTAPVEIIGGEAQPPPCDVTHTAPAVIFSTGATPATSSTTDYQYYWVAKYRRVLDHLAGGPEQAASWRRPRRRPPSSPRCTAFRGGGGSQVPRQPRLQRHRATRRRHHPRLPPLPPGGAVPLPPYSQSAARRDQRRPLLVLLSREFAGAAERGRVAELAREVGFRVERWGAVHGVQGGGGGDHPLRRVPRPPVLADPLAIDRLGYNVSGPYIIRTPEGTLNLTRFRESLLEALRGSSPGLKLEEEEDALIIGLVTKTSSLTRAAEGFGGKGYLELVEEGASANGEGVLVARWSGR